MPQVSASEVLPMWQHLSQRHWPEWGPLLRGQDDQQALDRQAGLAPVLLAFGQHLGLAADSLHCLPTAQRAALAVEWARSLCWRLTVPVLGLLVRHGIGLGVPAARLPLFLDADCRVAGWSWPADLAAQDLTAAPDAAITDWLHNWLAETWRPLIDELVQCGQADSRLLWQVLAGYWQWWLEQAVLQGVNPLETAAEHRQQLALAIVRQRDWPALVARIQPRSRSGRNPLYAPWRRGQDADGQPILQPRLCCHRDRLPGVATCPGCPLAGSPHKNEKPRS